MATTHPRAAPGRTMTYEEFLAWADEDTLAEWVDGQVIVNSPANAKHQLLVTFLLRVLSGYVDFHGAGTIMPAPFQMKLPHSGREPDILYLTAAHLDRLRPTYIDGPADLVVEVVSPDSVKRDREDKFREYAQGEVPEYWLLDPDAQVAAFYQLAPQGAYRAVVPDAAGVYRSAALPGFWLDVAWLWQVPHPDERDVLLDVIGQPYADDLRRRMQRRGL
jgi:Uma2 family endonuclease